MRIAIIQFPGSNCERETALAVKRAEMTPVDFLWNEPREKLASMDGYIMVGGFSYEDRSRAGIIAALDPIIQEMKQQNEKGKPILGICNGAQILVESGFVPGLENYKIGMALAENKRMSQGEIQGTGYYNQWIHLRLSAQFQRNAFTRYLTLNDILTMPVAHGEGRFVMTEALWQEIAAQGLAIFQYCDEAGNLTPQFPINPNGSMHNIAAMANKAGNVLAIMPHPERTIAGDVLFKSMRDSIATGSVPSSLVSLFYYPRQFPLPIYSPLHHARTYLIKLLITDNHALTVQHALKELGIAITVTRYLHWEIEADTSDDSALLANIKQSGVVYNDSKESIQLGEQFNINKNKLNTACFLVRDKENVIGQQALQTLQHHFNMTEVTAIYQGILWQFTSESDNISDLINPILATHIIANPYAHECYQYR